MKYNRFAEIGRVCLVQYGPDAGKLCTIVDILDQNRALVDGPDTLTHVRRQVINFKWLSLTPLTVKVQRNARQKTLAAAWKAADVQAKFAGSSWGKRLAKKQTTAALTDFGRFKAKVQQQKVSAAVKKALKA